MEGQSLIVFLIIGLIAGWLAGQIMKGSGFGIIGDLIVGVIGAFIGRLALGRASSAGSRAVVADRDRQRHHRRLHPALPATADQTLTAVTT